MTFMISFTSFVYVSVVPAAQPLTVWYGDSERAWSPEPYSLGWNSKSALENPCSLGQVTYFFHVAVFSPGM